MRRFGRILLFRRRSRVDSVHLLTGRRKRGKKRRTAFEGWPVVANPPLRWGKPSGGGRLNRQTASEVGGSGHGQKHDWDRNCGLFCGFVPRRYRYSTTLECEGSAPGVAGFAFHHAMRTVGRGTGRFEKRWQATALQKVVNLTSGFYSVTSTRSDVDPLAAFVWWQCTATRIFAPGFIGAQVLGEISNTT